MKTISNKKTPLENSTSNRLFSKCLLGLLISQTALAAEDATNENPSTPETGKIEEVHITGTRLQNKTFSGISPVVTINTDLEKLAGGLIATDLLQGSSMGASNFQINQQLAATGAGGVVTSGGSGFSGLSLRGLGPQRTLIVLDGNRLAPSGTKGEVSSVDLSVLPSSAIERIELVKDGSSSIYGADAVAGVVNGITKKNYDGASFVLSSSTPEQNGGERYFVSGDFGKTFKKGWFSMAGEYSSDKSLRNNQRDFFTCSEDVLFFPDTGERADIKTSDGKFKCRNHNPNGAFFDQQQASYALRNEDSAAYQNATAISPIDRVNLFFQGEYNFTDKFRFYGNLLYSKRESEFDSWGVLYNRMSANNPNNTVAAGLQAASGGEASGEILYQLMPPFNSTQKVQYYNTVMGLAGEFGSDWRWDAKVSYGRSDGDYSQTFFYQDRLNAISLGSSTCDASFLNPAVSDASLCDGINIPVLSTRFLVDQDWTEQERAFLSGREQGNTIYEQVNFEATLAGSIFELPAGEVEAVVGISARRDEIDDKPGINALESNMHNFSTAGRTAGSENVKEIFTEVGIPLLADKFLAHSVTATVSGRYTEYDISGGQFTSKAGINWSFTPSFALRGNYGTSFRGASLYELYLASQTSFFNIGDPCEAYADSTNNEAIANCQALGIPDDYRPASNGVQVTSGGAILPDGTSSIKPETSDSWSFGTLITPEDSGFSAAIDYFEILVKDEIDTLGAQRIVNSCYNDGLYCSLIQRNGADDPSPFLITGVEERFLNIDSQKVRGVDTTINYSRDFGELSLFTQLDYLYTLENETTRTLGEVVDIEKNLGDPNNPKKTAGLSVSLDWNNWNLFYRAQFIGSSGLTEEYGGDTFNFRGGYNNTELRETLDTDSVVYHTLSASHTFADALTFTLGVDNVLDEKPPTVSVDWKFDGYRTGTAAQNSWDPRGRTIFFLIRGKI